MPTQTFYNLKENKKNRIIEASKIEFSRVNLNDISIKNIVENAKIARGSFYQYFESKEDLIEYVINQEFESEKVFLNKLLKKNNGDIFDCSIEYYEYIIERKEKDSDMYHKHIYIYMRSKDSTKINKIDIEKICNYINVSVLNVKDEDDIFEIFKLLELITKTMIAGVLSGRIAKEEGLKRYKKQIELIKNGVLRKEN